MSNLGLTPIFCCPFLERWPHSRPHCWAPPVAAITAASYNCSHQPSPAPPQPASLLLPAAGAQDKVTRLSRAGCCRQHQQPMLQQAVVFLKLWANASQHTWLQPRLSHLPHAKWPTKSIMRAHGMETPRAASSTLERRGHKYTK